jgi:tRNA threonylcarbamoyladenosine biosynthesis protein TsaB
MLVLALDTTSRPGSVALARDGNLLEEAAGSPELTHAERLPEAIVALLERHSRQLAEIDLFAVAVGPGSFTGLRIGIATVQGLAFALDRPVAGVSALDALAEIAAGYRASNAAGQGSAGDAVESDYELLASWIDAQRNQVFAALYVRTEEQDVASRPPAVVSFARDRAGRMLEIIDGPVSEQPGLVLERWRGIRPQARICFAGDGLVRYRDLVMRGLGDRVRTIEPAPPLAAAVARIGLRQAAEGRALSPGAVKPLYVRRSDAELARERAGSLASGGLLREAKRP